MAGTGTFADCRAFSYPKNLGLFASLRSLYVLDMRCKRPKQLSEIQHARLLAEARVFCRTLNDLSASVSASGDDSWVLHELNVAVLTTVEKLTGKPAPWILPASGASYPDAGGGG